MKIAFLHLTMGLVERGSEGVVDQLATELSKNNKVLVIQSGKAVKKEYVVKRVYPLDDAPSPAPKNILDKLLFKLHLDDESGKVAEFTKASIPTLLDFGPDIVVAINGSLQIRILQGCTLKGKIVAFGHAGIGYHDKHTITASPDLFVALTPQAFDWARSIARSRIKVTYIPNPIDLREYKNVKPAKINLDKPIVITVSALSKYKNVLNNVAAVRRTIASFLLVGDGEQSQDVSREFSTFGNNFLWIKHLPQAEMPKYFMAADVFCFTPDPQEAFGMVYLEAMAAGLPIVASDDPIRRRIVGEQGIFVNPSDVDDIAAGINKAIQLGRIDYSKELTQYELKSVCKLVEKEFHDLIK